MKRITTIFISISLLVANLYSQTYTISGFISDKEIGETLLSAAVYEQKTGRGTTSNDYGFYTLSLPAGEVQIRYSYIGYKEEIHRFKLTKDTVMNIKLTPSGLLDEVVVLGNQNELSIKGTQMSAIEVPIAQIKKIPTLFGENDIIKALQLLPGVQAGTEGLAGMYVRGGGMDENLLLLDGVPVYNVNHMFGFFSVFNSDAIKNVTLYKGSFPARFSTRLSSIVDIRMKDGNEKQLKGNFSIGAISSKIQLEGPIWKGRTTFNLSARRTYMDLLLKPFMTLAARSRDDGIDDFQVGYYFYDLNAKITHKLSDKDRLFLSTYYGDDAMYVSVDEKEKSEGDEKIKMKTDWKWGNFITALRWNHIVNQKLFMNTTASHTRYRSKLGVGVKSERFSIIERRKEKTEENLTYNSGIEDWTLKVDFDYVPVSNHTLKLGANYTYHTFSPDVYRHKNKSSTNTFNIDTIFGAPKVYAQHTSSYLEDNITIGKIFKINAGLHFSTFHVQKENYFSLQPRLGLRILLNEKTSIKAGYAMMNQYVHMLSNNNISVPNDLWVSVTKRIKPMTSQQGALGVFYSLGKWGELSAEGYYKTMDNLLEYKDGANFMGTSVAWEDKVSMGRGIAYGVELLYQKKIGQTTGWIGYTWSKTDRIFDKPGQIINKGKPFPAKYDRRHDFSITVAHTFSEKFDIAATWVISTGNTGTFGTYSYEAQPTPNEINNNAGIRLQNTIQYIEHRNNFRFNPYHRLDLGVNFHTTTKRGHRATWNISLYNAYNQLNPFMIISKRHSISDPKKIKQIGQTGKLLQVSLFPIIPSVSYSLSF